MMRCLGLILAGGRARRMGGKPKHQLLLDGRSFLSRACHFLAGQSQGFVISLNRPPDALCLESGARAILPDPVPGYAGPLAGILAGLFFARAAGYQKLLSLPVDTPLLGHAVPAALRHSANAAQIVFAAVRADDGTLDKHPVIAIWDVATLPALFHTLTAGHQRKLMPFIAAQQAGCLVYPAAFAPLFTNVNSETNMRGLASCAAFAHLSCRPRFDMLENTQ